MADYFVKVGGNDGNDGTTWALAKATVQAGLNLCTGAGDRLVVAPGRYYETGLAPAAAGARGTPKILYGDYDSTITDGGASTSGVAAGHIIVDGSVQSGNKGWSTVAGAVIATSDYWPYWNWTNIIFIGQDPQYSPTTAGTATDGNVFDSCAFFAVGGQGFDVSNWTIVSDAPGSPVTFKNCISQGSNYNTGTTEASAFRSTFLDRVGSYQTNPQVILQRCILLGAKAGLRLYGDSNHYGYWHLKNCTVLSLLNNDTTYSMIAHGGSSSYNKVIFDDCFLYAYGPAAATLNATYNTCKTYYNTANASTESMWPLSLFVPYLLPGSSLIDTNSSPTNTITPDIWGVSVPQNSTQDYGAQEYKSGAMRYPKEPTMIPGTHDIPDIGNVLNTDTSDGSTGTYAGGGGRPEIRGGNL